MVQLGLFPFVSQGRAGEDGYIVCWRWDSLPCGHSAFPWGLEMPLSSVGLRDPPPAASAGGACSVPCWWLWPGRRDALLTSLYLIEQLDGWEMELGSAGLASRVLGTSWLPCACRCLLVSSWDVEDVKVGAWELFGQAFSRDFPGW